MVGELPVAEGGDIEIGSTSRGLLGALVVEDGMAGGIAPAKRGGGLVRAMCGGDS